MPYPKKLLNEGEEVALDLRPHWWYFAKQILTGIPLFIIVILIFAELSKSPRKYTLLFWAVIAVAWAAWLVHRYSKWNFTHFVVTTDRVIYRSGVLSKHGVEIPMERINNINFHQGIFERIIGAGDLDIESAGKDGQSHFDDIWHPDAVQQEIYRMMESNARKRASWSAPQAAPAPAPAAAAAPAPGVPEQLAQLAELRDKGVITAAEFETKKAQLLERM